MQSIILIDHPQQAPSEILRFGVTDSPVGPATIWWDETGVRRMGFGEEPPAPAIERYAKTLRREDSLARDLVAQAFAAQMPLPLVLSGTAFQRRVWLELTKLAVGQTVSYTELAARVGLPKGARAVGNAVAANQIGFIVPCHRVVRQSAQIGQFRWGSAVKGQLLQWESEQAQSGV